jgi:hypothetical protein
VTGEQGLNEPLAIKLGRRGGALIQKSEELPEKVSKLSASERI